MTTQSVLADREQPDSIPLLGRHHGTAVVVGAYAAARSDLAAVPEAEAAWYRALRSNGTIGGLELAFDETLHRAGVQHLATLLHPEWQSVVTCIPGTGRILQTINWARSTIETRDTASPILHLEQLRGAGALTAVRFSGVSPVGTRFGGEWMDAHLPARSENATGTDAEASSLLTAHAIREALEHAGPLSYTGVKVGAGTDSPDAETRLKPTLATLDQVLAPLYES